MMLINLLAIYAFYFLCDCLEKLITCESLEGTNPSSMPLLIVIAVTVPP